MVGCHHQLNGHEFEQTPGDGEGQEDTWHAAVLGVAKSQIRRTGLATYSQPNTYVELNTKPTQGLVTVVSDSLRPHGLQPPRLLCLWDFPDKNTGVGCYFLLQIQNWTEVKSLAKKSLATYFLYVK